MKVLIAVLLLGSAALVFSEEDGTVTAQSGNAQCSQLPTCETPYGTDGWTNCDWLDSGAYVRTCTAMCNVPYFSASPRDPTTRCSNNGGWEDPTGNCIPTAQNCQNTQPDNRGSTVSEWDCSTLQNSDYVKGCTGTCGAGFVSDNLLGDPTAHCSRYTGKWHYSGGCVAKTCSVLPTNPPPTGTIGWDSANCDEAGGFYYCVAKCRPGYVPSPTEPRATCSLSTGDWSATTGSCVPDTPTDQCGKMPPNSVRPPTNSYGWTQQECYATMNSLTCYAECKPGYVGNPSVKCTLSNGQWGTVSGSCVPDGPVERCSQTPEDSSGRPLPDPPGSEGWSASDCYTQGSSYVCRAMCQEGYKPAPLMPTATCSLSTGRWSSVTGRCESVQQACPLLPQDAAPANTVGWDPRFCYEVDGVYTCEAKCKPGYVPASGTPSASCDTRSANPTFGPPTGYCIPEGSGNTCSDLPNVQAPPNSDGWSRSKCYTTGGAPGQVTTTCIATCQPGYEGANGYDPSATCDWKTGSWTVNGFCKPNDDGGNCYNSNPNVPPPPNSKGWVCYTMGYGPYATRVCTSACADGYYGSPCAPTIECMGSGRWSQVSGQCIPYGGGKPCWGYPGGYPTCYGGKGIWRKTCGGQGKSYYSRTYAKKCYYGSSCYDYTPAYVKHNTRCRASCAYGKGGYQAVCINGVWTEIQGGCRY